MRPHTDQYGSGVSLVTCGDSNCCGTSAQTWTEVLVPVPAAVASAGDAAAAPLTPPLNMLKTGHWNEIQSLHKVKTIRTALCMLSSVLLLCRPSLRCPLRQTSCSKAAADDRAALSIDSAMAREIGIHAMKACIALSFGRMGYRVAVLDLEMVVCSGISSPHRLPGG
jgi:hypothetical protein